MQLDRTQFRAPVEPASHQLLRNVRLTWPVSSTPFLLAGKVAGPAIEIGRDDHQSIGWPELSSTADILYRRDERPCRCPRAAGPRWRSADHSAGARRARTQAGASREVKRDA